MKFISFILLICITGVILLKDDDDSLLSNIKKKLEKKIWEVESTYNTTQLLDELLLDYNPTVRPSKYNLKIS
jgi:hypothetical protein